jgi:biopolymer transport protein ExbB
MHKPSVSATPLRPLLVLLPAAVLMFALAPAASAQEEPTPPSKQAIEDLAAQDAAAPAAPAQPAANQSAAPKKELNWLTLMLQGGPLMVPIAGCSLIVLIFGFERLLALRRGKVLPSSLVHGLGQVFNVNEQLSEDDLKTAYKLCNTYPSAASVVIKVALLKASRPHSEVEQAVKEASEREANRLYGNVRPINLCTSVAPLLGLLGTIQGMIMAFFITSTGEASANKAEALAEGIYTALVTTFAGLVVAIPAATLAHWFEGKIQRLFMEVEELLLGILPALEQFENKVEIRRTAAVPSAAPPPPGTPLVPPQGRRAAPPSAKSAPPPRHWDREEQRGI